MLLFLVFVTEWALLMIEMAAFKMFAPHFGTSLYIWGNIIGIVMIGASLGYWFGGRLADRRPEKKILVMIVLVAGTFILTIPFLFSFFTSLFETSSYPLLFSFLLGVPLFGVPAFFIELAPPFAVRLLNKDLENTGRSVGSVYGFSTVGGILGVLTSSLITIPFWGIKETVILSGAVLIVCALIILFKINRDER